MSEPFWIIIVVAVLIGVFCAYGPRAMLAIIAIPALFAVVVFAWIVFKPDPPSKIVYDDHQPKAECDLYAHLDPDKPWCSYRVPR